MYKLPVLLLCIFVALILCQIIALISKKRRGGKVSSQKAVIVKIDESITGVYSPVRCLLYTSKGRDGNPGKT